MPTRIQFDNGGPFVSPTGLGEVARVCLRQGATPVFIPPREPWRNGTIERFNDSFDQRFTGLEHLTERAEALERFHWSTLTGTPATELEAVIENIHGIAAAGMLTPSRLPTLFLTLDRNPRWWTTGPLLSSGRRVEFAGSQIVWEYYPGQGIELQELGSFGQADWMYGAGPNYWRRLRSLVDELIPLAADRGSGLAWEYYFNFDGGIPPWTSAMSQGTAVQALTQTYEATHDSSYLDLARRSIPIFGYGPPVGVGIRTSLGRRYLLYSFAPDPSVAVITGFLQTLIGLFDYAKLSRDPEDWRLFRSGDAEAAPNSRATTPAPGRSTSRARRTRSTTTHLLRGSCSNFVRARMPRPTVRQPRISRPTSRLRRRFAC